MPDPSLIKYANIAGLSFALRFNNSTSSIAAGIVDTSASPSQAVDDLTMFQAASLSKVVSAAIALDLFKENNWNLDVPLCKRFAYGPQEFQNHPYYQNLTPRMILSQRSGLPNWSEDSKLSFVAEPGTQFTYSGLAFDFLKQAIEDRTHKKWEDLAQDFFRRAGMGRSTFLQSSIREGQKIARGHDGYGVPEQAVPSQDSVEVPAASLLTTSREYIIFLNYCLNDPYLSKVLFAPQTHLTASQFPKISGDMSKIKWGLGIGLFENNEGRTIAFHWGNNPYSHAFAAMDVTSGDSVACFVNSANGPNVFKHITQAVLGDMTLVFDWLEQYCGFNAVVGPRNQPLKAGSFSRIVDKKNALGSVDASHVGPPLAARL